MHEENCFVTLTYDDDHLPADGSLDPDHVRLWLYRFRKALRPKRIRFFAVGEYGEGGKREINPHYHVSVFGISGLSLVSYGGRVITVAQLVIETWGKGIESPTYEFNERTASYVAGYTTKKLTEAGHPKLGGRHPEFMRSSRRPGLGVDAMRVVAEQLVQSGHMEDDVPRVLKLGRKNIPLGRFMLKKLREFAGMSPDAIQKVKDAISYERSLEMQALFKVHGDDSAVPTFKSAHVKEVHQRVLNAEARYKIWDRKKESL